MASVSSLLNPSEGDKPQSSPPSAPLPPTQPAQNETTEAAQALASLSTSPGPASAQWQDSSMPLERRASGYELPPPTVTSRSPEQRRPSAVQSPQPSNITLPPIHDLPSATSQAAAVQLSGAISPEASARRTSIMEDHTLKSVALLKTEHSQRAQSPLRESSVPVPSTEDPTKDELPVPSKKRPAPAKTKKGTAATVKKEKAPPAKKRKVDTKRADTPSSRASKAPTVKGTSTKGTPLNSSPAPSMRSYSAEPQDEQDEDDEEEDDEGRSQDGDLYCLCRRPDTGTFMIGCDGKCDDWFHGKCVNIAERDKNLIDKYICPACTTAGVGQTTWKRMCRRDGCRQPAKTSKSKTGGHISKYCSDDCGVLYFNEMLASSRGEDGASRRGARNKGSMDFSDKQDNEIGARGGALAAGEVKALLNVSQTAEEFRKLGDGVLSPPATPDGTDDKTEPEYTDAELHELEKIDDEKGELRQRHALFKDKMKFVNLAKQAASRVASEKELKPKEYCGYDPRLEWSEDRFLAWRNSTAGQQAFESDTLVTEKNGTADDSADDDEPVPDICNRKKCARHLDWAKLAVDDLRHEMADNGDRMRIIERDVTEMKERAVLRTKTAALGNGGSVEMHGQDSEAAMVKSGEEATEMEVDVIPTVEAPDAMVVDAV